MAKTRRDFLKTAGAAAIGAGAVLTGSRKVHAQAAPQFKWKAQCLWSPAETSYKAFDAFCQRIKVITNGRLEITPFPSGSIVPNIDCADAVKNNVMQAAHQAVVYYSGKIPALAPLGDLVYAWDHPWEADLYFHYGGGFELLSELYKKLGMHLVGVMWWGLESSPSRNRSAAWKTSKVSKSGSSGGWVRRSHPHWSLGGRIARHRDLLGPGQGGGRCDQLVGAIG
jgi:TRAP-type C4-dicarboxylate transport system substrate-binding protein